MTNDLIEKHRSLFDKTTIKRLQSYSQTIAQIIDIMFLENKIRRHNDYNENYFKKRRVTTMSNRTRRALERDSLVRRFRTSSSSILQIKNIKFNKQNTKNSNMLLLSAASFMMMIIILLFRRQVEAIDNNINNLNNMKATDNYIIRGE